MVYVDPGELRWKPYVQTWVEYKFPAKLSDATKVHMCDMLTYTHMHTLTLTLSLTY